MSEDCWGVEMVAAVVVSSSVECCGELAMSVCCMEGAELEGEAVDSVGDQPKKGLEGGNGGGGGEGS